MTLSHVTFTGQMSLFKCHVSCNVLHVSCHLSKVICQMPSTTCQISFVTFRFASINICISKGMHWTKCSFCNITHICFHVYFKMLVSKLFDVFQLDHFHFGEIGLVMWPSLTFNVYNKPIQIETTCWKCFRITYWI